MTWRLGDTFYGSTMTNEPHLHVVVIGPYISATGETVVLTTVSSYNGNSRSEEDACILRSSDGHSFIKHTSYIMYAKCVEISVSRLDDLLDRQAIKQKESFNQDVQKRILHGLAKSELASMRFVRMAEKELLHVS